MTDSVWGKGGGGKKKPPAGINRNNQKDSLPTRKRTKRFLGWWELWCGEWVKTVGKTEALGNQTITKDQHSLGKHKKQCLKKRWLESKGFPLEGATRHKGKKTTVGRTKRVKRGRALKGKGEGLSAWESSWWDTCTSWTKKGVGVGARGRESG